MAGPVRGYTFDSEDPVKRIDYIFTSGGVQLMHSRVVDAHRVASDHLPMAVKLRVIS